jgi:3',5'-cyclic AMP phosphodiesterase CpdA
VDSAATQGGALVQISDPHIGGEWGLGDPVALLSEAVAAIGSLDVSIAGVLVSGDLTEHGHDAEYALVRELLAPLDAATFVLPGNHDDRSALRRHFPVPGSDGEPVQYAVEVGGMRLVVVDSTRPGEDPGELDAARLAWLDETLAAAPGLPTIVALHHTPVVTGVPVVDEAGLPAEHRDALGEVVRRHPHVERIAGGHVHLTMVASLGGRPVIAAPSTYVQARSGAGETEVELIELTEEGRGFVVHALIDGQLFSTVEPVGNTGRAK